MTALDNSVRYWKVRVDCWYEPHRDPGAKKKEPKRVVRYVILEAPNSEEAIKRGVEWADSTADPTKGRRWIHFDHRSTGPVKFPMEVSE